MTDCPLAAAIAKHNITLKSVFVPFSQSRYKAEKNPCLNWKVTLCVNAREIFTTDYMAGSAHCPAYGKAVPKSWDRPTRFYKDAACAFECEDGYETVYSSFGSRGEFKRKNLFAGQNAGTGRASYKYFPIMPDISSFVACLLMDSDVLNYRGFADWAENYGYSADSIKDKALYDECMSSALNLRAGLSETVMNELKEAAQDF